MSLILIHDENRFKPLGEPRVPLNGVSIGSSLQKLDLKEVFVSGVLWCFRDTRLAFSCSQATLEVGIPGPIVWRDF